MSVKNLQNSLNGIHKALSLKSANKQKSAIESHNRKSGVKPGNFDVDEFVLRGLLQRERGLKLSLKWKGPYRVTECNSDYIFQIENLSNGDREDAHGRRLQFFQSSAFEAFEEIPNHLSYQQDELLMVQDFEDIRKRSGTVELLAR